VFLLRGFVERVKELVALGYGYLQTLLGLLARLVFPDESLSLVCHNAPILHPMSALYEGCWHKLDRAKMHVGTLKRDIGVRLAHANTGQMYGYRQEFDPHLNCLSTFVNSVERPPVEWSLIIGDALTNFRAALDYLAHDLAGRGSKPHKRGTRDPSFVICRTVKDANGRDARKRIEGGFPGIKPRHRAVIEDFQPYQWLEWSDAHPLALLDRLVRWDKHREIEPVFSQHAGYFQMAFTDPTDFVPERAELGQGLKFRPPRRRLEPNTEVARVFGRRIGPNPSVVVHFKSTFSIAFKNGDWVEGTLDKIGKTILQLFTAIEPIL
jgi:hypothetical protein